MDGPVLRGWLLYDDSCGFCRSWIPFWETTLQRRGYGIARLQDDWVRRALNVREDELLADLRLLLVSGEQVRGATCIGACCGASGGPGRCTCCPSCR